jgi:hypothetical protein
MLFVWHFYFGIMGFTEASKIPSGDRAESPVAEPAPEKWCQGHWEQQQQESHQQCKQRGAACRVWHNRMHSSEQLQPWCTATPEASHGLPDAEAAQRVTY